MPSSDFAAGADYSSADRLLHRLALGFAPTMETSFDLEWARFGKTAEARPAGPPIFVCGLARAGTSLVTRLIASAPGIAFPSYRDMHFPLAPNLWARLGGRKRRVAHAERGHADGLGHDLDTPEAIEEAFWRCFEGRRYIRRDGLSPAEPEAATLAAFGRYMALVRLRGNGERYLSKNNNNILRVHPLAEAFPDALFVHPFRHPLAQARSLERQHERACALQRGDRFRLHYANWLVHREFGLGRLSFRLPGFPSMRDELLVLDDWLAAWTAVYAHLLALPSTIRERQFFLDYDSLCRSPASVMETLAEFLGLGAIAAPTVRPGESAGEEGRLPPDTERIHAALFEAACRGSSSPVSGPPLGSRP